MIPKYTQEYKDVIGAVFLISLILFIIGLAIFIPKAEKFVYYVPQNQQPNCIVGSFCMLAKESLDVELKPNELRTKYNILNRDDSNVSTIKVIWNDMFPAHHLECVYCVYNSLNLERVDTNHGIVFNKPYVWVGKWDVTNEIYHTCLVYFRPKSVIFKHFVMSPATETNYMVFTNYDFFFERTAKVYVLRHRIK